LTGESVPVGHRGRQHDDPGDVASAGTVVVKGRAVVEVSRTGASSALGRIAALTDVRSGPTPLQHRMAQLGRMLAIIAVVLCGVVLGLGLARGEPAEVMVVTAISLAVAAVPESLPAVVALSLAMGAHRMAARNAIVRRLPAVETLGSVTVLATDKTGTLTQAQMLVEELWTPTGVISVTGEGYQPTGEFLHDGTTVAPSQIPQVLRLLEAGALCNDARLVPPKSANGAWSGLGDPTEIALLVVAAKADLTRDALQGLQPRIGEVPFDSAAQHMTTIHARPGRPGSFRVVRKGSPEALAQDSRADHAVWREALRQASEFAERGLRVLAMAVGEVSDPHQAAEAPCRLVGLIAMDDPAKPAARRTLAACRAAGIIPVLITGDHPVTARAVATRVGLITAQQADDPGLLATGDQIAQHELEDLTAPRIFARTRPEQKLSIIAAWQNRGAVVAMTGDGVNDGPALRRADIGVAMGHRGTEIARQAADVVLADDELGTVEHAVEEGRRVYDNIRRFLVFGMGGGAAEILLMLLGPLTGLVVPLLAAQILWMNLLTHGLTGVAMGAEPAEAGVMHRPPRPPEQSVIGGGLWQRVVVIGSTLGTVSLGLGLWAQAGHRPWQSMVFLALTCMQLGVALGLRPTLFTRANLWLPLAIAGSMSLALAGIYLPALQDLLTLHALPPLDLVLALTTGIVGWLTARLQRRQRVGWLPPGEAPAM
jgi:Ca2+-transporting ATPase